jgi:hypothetical protein
MLDIPSISAIVAVAGVLVGVALTVLELRDFVKTRRTDMLWRLLSSFNSKEYLEAYLKTVNLEFKDYNDFSKKYGSGFSETPVQVALSMVCNLFEGAGTLLYRRLIDFETVALVIPVSYTWEKVKPIADGMRKELNLPDLWTGFEYLYNEMKKREQQLASKTA